MAGYYFSCCCVVLSGVTLFALNYVHYQEPVSPENNNKPNLQKSRSQLSEEPLLQNPENGEAACSCPSNAHKIVPAGGQQINSQYRKGSEASSAVKNEYLACIAEEDPGPDAVQYDGEEYDFEYAVSCNKVTDFLLYNDFDERYSSSVGPNGPCSTQSQPQAATDSKPVPSSIHNNLSYSEPEGLSRIGQSKIEQKFGGNPKPPKPDVGGLTGILKQSKSNSAFPILVNVIQHAAAAVPVPATFVQEMTTTV
jgi:hypothetical protein